MEESVFTFQFIGFSRGGDGGIISASLVVSTFYMFNCQQPVSQSGNESTSWRKSIEKKNLQIQ